MLLLLLHDFVDLNSKPCLAAWASSIFLLDIQKICLFLCVYIPELRLFCGLCFSKAFENIKKVFFQISS